jgi:hypothetical protein
MMDRIDFINFIEQNNITRNTVVEIVFLLKQVETTVILRMSFLSNPDTIAIGDGDTITGSYTVGDTYLRGMPLSGSIPIEDIVKITILMP